MDRDTVVEGVIGGTIGAVVVAMWFLLVDGWMGRPFWTPALLAAALFDGIRDAGMLHVSGRLVVEYTALHGIAFLVFGIAAAALLAASDRDPRLLSLVVMLFCCFEVSALALVAVLAEWLLDVLAWWSIVTANVLASLGMLGFFLGRHRGALRDFLGATH